MIELAAVFWIFVVIFGVIGLMRGWTKEVLVTASLILALFILEQFGVYIFDIMIRTTGPATIAADPNAPLRRLVMLKAAGLLIITFFGYQGPTLVRSVSRGRVSTRRGESLQEGLLGLLIGGLNGYIVVGTLWWYLQIHNYPFSWVISPDNFPDSTSFALLRYLPLQWLGQGPLLELLLVGAFLFVIIAIV